MAALLRTSPNLGLRIRNLALTRTQQTPSLNTRFASSLDTPIRTTPPASRTTPRRTTSSPHHPRKEFVSAFVGGTTIDDTTPSLPPPASVPKSSSSSPTFSRRSSPTRAVATASSASTPHGLPSKHLLVTKDFAKYVQKNRTPQQVLDHVMEARYQRDRDFMLGRILNEYLKQNQVYNIEPLIIEMEKRGLSVQSETYTILLRGLATFAFSSSHTTAAQSLYSRLKSQYDHPPTIEQANSMIRMYQRLGNNIEGIEQVYNDMAKKGPDAPTVVTYGTLIKSYGRIGGDRAFERAWRVWVEYLNTTNIRREDGDVLDTGMLGAILTACKEALNPDYVRRGYRLFESYYGMQTGLPTPLGAASVVPAGFTAGGAGGYGHVRHQGGPRKTSSVALDESASNKGLTISKGTETAKADDPRPEMLELVMMISSQLGEFDRGIRYMEFIRETFPEFEPSNRNLTTYMRLQTAAKDYNGAFRTFDEIEALGQEHTRASWKQGLQTAFEANDWSRTIGMYNEFKKRSQKGQSSTGEMISHDAWTLATTLRVAVRTNHLTEALEILQESQWQNVIKSREFPRANLDIARAAVKAYSEVLHGPEGKVAQSSSGTEEWSNDETKRGGDGKDDKIVNGVNLTQELKTALKIRNQLEFALADYHSDGGKAYKKRAVSHGEELIIGGESSSSGSGRGRK
ncbi:hypothetical protein K457DRAFT_127984 [Linnemannia elongata AG-77]|uniref:Pentacotripeptide-repeat region of PRORP domain-containing protein n=1 Tax=Linnemannia elongata AG-77 TaxID=1314771 RepID=A0A197JR56_9FUNG|nr:hypothetical protein K457DRAFT_127984 [Linnemannia elongata AG-77]